MSSAADQEQPAMRPASSSSERAVSPVKKNTGVVQHHEIGEMAHFLSAFGKSKEDAVKTLIASSLQIVGLEEVKKKYEGKWESIEDRVYKAIEAFFTKKLRKQDTFVQLQEGRFALIFVNMSLEEGQEKANELARELINLLFGQMPGVDLISVEAMVIDPDLTTSVENFNSLEEIIDHIQNAIKGIDEKEQEQLKEVEPELSVLFRPAINHRKKLISISEAIPCRKSPTETVVLAQDDPMMMGSAKLRSELDLLILRETGKALERLGDPGNKPIVMVSVAFETLANAYVRRKYADQMKELPDYTQRHLILNLEGIGPGIPYSRFRQILTSVSPQLLGFVIEVGKGWNDFETISDLPILAVGVDSNEQEDLPWIGHLIERAKETGMKISWRNLDNDDLARQAFKLGVDYVSGSVIGGLQEIPTRPFSIKNV